MLRGYGTLPQMSLLLPVTTSPCQLEYSIHGERTRAETVVRGLISSRGFAKNVLQDTGEKCLQSLGEAWVQKVLYTCQAETS